MRNFGKNKHSLTDENVWELTPWFYFQRYFYPDNSLRPRKSTGYCREYTPPFRKGGGFILRVTKRWGVHIGFWRSQQFRNEEDGILSAMKGRRIEGYDPNTIGGWGIEDELADS